MGFFAVRKLPDFRWMACIAIVRRDNHIDLEPEVREIVFVLIRIQSVTFIATNSHSTQASL